MGITNRYDRLSEESLSFLNNLMLDEEIHLVLHHSLKKIYKELNRFIINRFLSDVDINKIYTYISNSEIKFLLDTSKMVMVDKEIVLEIITHIRNIIDYSIIIEEYETTHNLNRFLKLFIDKNYHHS